MTAPVVLAIEAEAWAGGLAFAVLCISVAAYYIVAEWRRAREAKIETDLKREMVQKSLSADEIERILKATTPPRIF